MRHLKILLLILAALGSGPIYAKLKGQAKIDSLVKELSRLGEDTNKVNVLNEIARGYLRNNNNYVDAIKYAQVSFELSEKIGSEIKIGESYNVLGFCYFGQNNHAKALAYFELALKSYEAVGNKLFQSGVLASIAGSYFYTGNYQKAEEVSLRSLKLAKEVGDKKRMGISLNTLGNICSSRGEYQKSLEYFIEAQKIFEELDDNENKLVVAGNIGGLLKALGEYNKALECFQQMLADAREAKQLEDEAVAANNIAGVYVDNLKDYAKAIEYNSLALTLYEKANNKRGVAFATFGLGISNLLQKEYVLALDYSQKAAELAREIDDKGTLIKSLNCISEAYYRLAKDTSVGINQYYLENDNIAGSYLSKRPVPKGRAALLSASIKYGEEALALATETGNKSILVEIYLLLSWTYELSGNYKKALEASDNHHALKDTIFSRENKEEILKMSMKNDYDRQRLADSLKTAEQQKIAAINLQKQKSYTYMGVAGILLLAGFSFFIMKERGKSEKARKQSDELLLNILPEEVADELKTNGITTAKHYDNVTVLFTDFVNFTKAGEQMSPQNLIDELHSCFKAFDEISDKYNIEKIKTIGDAYLAVAGLPTADPKHAENVIKAAKEITAFMEDRLGKMGTERTFQVRVGIHSGSVVAGIVGVKKFAYDIWGDTVNTAARMEQNSEAGKINISHTTYELVKDKFTCEYRGEVEAKGKGVMKMYFVS
jgi:adenylate cyclase